MQGSVPLPLLKCSLDLPFHDAVQHHLWFSLNLCHVVRSSSISWDFCLWEQHVTRGYKWNFWPSWLEFAGLCTKKVALFLVVIQLIKHKFCSTTLHIGWSRWQHGLRPGSMATDLLGYWIQILPGCLSLVNVLCCHVEIFVTGRSLFQRSPIECGVSKWVWSRNIVEEA